jgi:hypothetical protein
MTTNQITKKLVTAKIPVNHLDIKNRQVAVYVTDNDGDCNRQQTQRLANRIRRVLGWSGYSSGTGREYITEDYVPIHR